MVSNIAYIFCAGDCDLDRGASLKRRAERCHAHISRLLYGMDGIRKCASTCDVAVCLDEYPLAFEEPFSALADSI